MIPYQKQNFTDGEILFAKQLNKIEGEIHEMSKEPNIYVQWEEPEDVAEGDVWIISSGDSDDQISLEVPPYTEEDYGKVLSPSVDGLVWIEMSGGSSNLPSAEEESF